MPYKAKDGSIWVGGSQGLYKLSRKEKKILPFTSYENFEELQTSAIYAFYDNKSGTWLSTSTGLYLLDLVKEKVLARYSSHGIGDNYIPSNHIAHLHEDEEGIFWLATKGNGLIKWNPVTKEHQQFTQNGAGLSHNILYAVYGDDFGYLWMSSDRGLMRFNKKSEYVNIYLKEDGIPDNEFNTISHYKSDDGHLYFGGQNGVVSFHPKDFQEVKKTTPFVITSYSKQNKNTDKIKYLTADLLSSKTIRITPEDKAFALKFALLDYRNPKANQYSYKIEGYDKDWNYQSESQIKINGLPYGTYQLKLRAKASGGGAWIDYPDVIQVDVIRPFYLQWWFIVLVLLVTITTVGLTVKWRTKQLITRQGELEAIVEKRTKKIAQQTQELKALDKVKSRFFANISHELRTPLTLILGPVSTLLRKPRGVLDEKEVRKSLSTMKNNGESLLTLVEEILDLSKLEAHKLELEEEQVHLESYVQEVFGSFESQATYLNVAFLLKFKAKDNLYLLLDPNKVEKILNNLLSNALKFTPAGQQVLMAVTDLGKEIQFEVRDTGKGIHPKDLPHVFERFYQSEQADKKAQGGTGIGLALVSELTKLMQGTVEATSTLGEGSCFTVCLPKQVVAISVEEHKQTIAAIQQRMEIEEGEKSWTPINKELTILLVEDHVDMLNFIRGLLDSYYNIVVATNGLEGLAKLKEHGNGIDMIISDVMMPHMDGFTMLKEIKASKYWRLIPMMMLTARAAADDKLNALTIGVDDYLTKPFSVDELMVRVANLLYNAQERKRWLAEQKEVAHSLPLNEGNEGEIVDSDLEWIKSVEEIVQEELGNATFVITDLSKRMHISKRQLERRIKKATGMTPAKMIKEVRLNAARKHLEKGTYKTVSEVAFVVGFQTVETFSKTFKSRFGKSPSSYI